MKTIVLYESEEPIGRRVYHGINETLEAINNENIDFVPTTQICVLSKELINLGHYVWIKPKNMDCIRITEDCFEEVQEEIRNKLNKLQF